MPTANSVWAHIGFDSLGNDTKWFLTTADGGSTWRFDTIAAPDGYVIGSVAPINGNTCYASMYNQAVGIGSGIFKTTNGGVSWKQLSSGKLFGDNSVADFVYFFNAANGLAVGDAKEPGTPLEIYTTCDAGVTWKRVPGENIPSTAGTPYSFDFQVYAVFKNTIWFRGYDDQGNFYLYRSDDLGHHWQLFNSSPDYVDFAFSDKLNGVATGYDENGKFVAVSNDGGKTFAKKTYSGYPMDFISAIPGTHTFVTTSACCSDVFGSSYSNDYGTTWHLIDSGASAIHTDVDFLSPLIGWTGEGFNPNATGGIYKWKLHFSLDNNAIAANNNNNISSATKNDLSNPVIKLYPNPAKDVLKIEGLNASSKTMLSLYTISGKLVQQSTAAGSNYTLNLQKLAAGNYYITIQSGEKTATLKFIKE